MGYVWDAKLVIFDALVSYVGALLLLMLYYWNMMLNTNYFCLFYYYLGYLQMMVMPIFCRDCVVLPYFFYQVLDIPAAIQSLALLVSPCAIITSLLIFGHKVSLYRAHLLHFCSLLDLSLL